jgi:hypothetical protein
MPQARYIQWEVVVAKGARPGQPHGVCSMVDVSTQHLLSGSFGAPQMSFLLSITGHLVGSCMAACVATA